MKGNAASRKSDNHALSRAARHAIAKSLLDISELTIACSSGTCELFGKVRPSRENIGFLNVKKEFENLKNMIRNVRGVREVHGDRVRIFE